MHDIRSQATVADLATFIRKYTKIHSEYQQQDGTLRNTLFSQMDPDIKDSLKKENNHHIESHGFMSWNLLMFFNLLLEGTADERNGLTSQFEG